MGYLWLLVIALFLPCETMCMLNSSSTLAPDTEAEPSYFLQLLDSTASYVGSPWVDTEAASRQGPGSGVLRITIGTFLTALAAALLSIIGVGGIGLLAAKALSVGLLALFLAGMSALKHHYKHDSGRGQTVHYVPVHHETHHDIFHDRNDIPTPYFMNRNT